MIKKLALSKEELDFKSVFNSNKVIHLTNNSFFLDIGDRYIKLASEIGVPLLVNENPIDGSVQFNSWSEIKFVRDNQNDSFKYSNKFQPLHTDYAYVSFDVFASFMFCEEQASFGGATTFFEVNKLVELLEFEDKYLFEELQMQKVQFGRSNSPLAQKECVILSKEKNEWFVNWNYYRVIPNEKYNTLISNFRLFIENNIERSGEMELLKLNKGEAVFFHDRKVLHGRNSFIGERFLKKGAIVESFPKVLESYLKL
jgi:alpha-ketoglutarate-dependent taurine dioxygenase